MASPVGKASSLRLTEEDRTPLTPDDERSVPSESVSRQGSFRQGSFRQSSFRQGSFRSAFSRDGSKTVPLTVQDGGSDAEGVPPSFPATDKVPARLAQQPDLELGLQSNNFKAQTDGHWTADTTTYKLSVINLTYKVLEKKGNQKVEKILLNEVNARAKHGEILAVMGPSGSGKTTFLDSIAGRIQRQSLQGAILVNGHPVDSSFMKVSQYVQQDDALFPLLTTTETLMFSARFRLPASMSHAEKQRRVEVIIQQLGLKSCANTFVGNDLVKGVSGGERRRVSIGVELINDPAVIFLDEPTSGLDSTSALHVVEILSMLAVERQRLIILTIHQPSFRILDLISNILILARGHGVYHGRVQDMSKFFQDFGRQIPENVNVVEYALDAIEHYQDDPVGFQSLVSHQKEKYKVDALDRPSSLNDKREPIRGSGYGPFGREMLTLAERTFKNILRTPELFISRIGLAIVTAILLGTIFLNVDINEKGDRQRQAFFAFAIALFIFTTTESLPIFLAERQIYIREASRGAYRPSTYTLSQALIFTPFLFIMAVIYVCISYFMVGLVKDASAFFIVVLTLSLTLVTANAFVAVAGALLPSFLVANALSTAVFAFMFLFSGFFIPRSSIPDYWIWMHYLSLFKYPLEILLYNEYSRIKGTWYGTSTSESILNGLSMGRVHIWENIAIMLAMVVAYRFFFYLILRFRTNNIRN
eukprot:TRINITY_DN5430_c0_g1_i1.p1 TRINITY_DN5430_c0_g1~~TRINITY_DN5430_c0_g1_i1.p1  ORF type:complete len:704 (+),score=97.37 TRINITY_DN5430_c0_g1_i1:271-2382(+)